MTHFRVVAEIAQWEFRRWFKVKDQVVTLGLAIGLSFLFWGGMALLILPEDAPVKLFVINKADTPLHLSSKGRLSIERAPVSDEVALRHRLGKREIDGLVILHSVDQAELIVLTAPPWRSEVGELLSDARKEVKIRELNLSPSQLEDAFAPSTLLVTIHEEGNAPTSGEEKAVAVILVILMLVGVINGAAYQFASITGEKQLRLTEVIVSAITPQQWIDGKILGTSLHSLAATGTFALAIILFVLVSIPFNSGWSIPATVTSPFILISLVTVALSGYMFWCTFFGALAATINDPNTSARSSLLMLPALPIGFAFFGIGNPDSIGMRILSIFPLTSPGLLPVRLVLADVAWWEVMLATLLLCLCVWFLRIAAGRIFHLGMLIQGKEPSLKEVLRWAKKA